MSYRAKAPFVALLALGVALGVGCKKKGKDDHWTGGGAMGAEGTRAAEDGEGGARAAEPMRPADTMGSEAMAGEAMAGADPGLVSAPGKNPRVAFRTSLGDFLVELDPRKAPLTVKNFLRYVDEKFYDGTIFHRVMVDFMIQGGGFGEDLQQKQPHEPIKNEADNGLRNLRGTIAMARTNVVDSATAQFFINVKDNPALDHRGPGPGFGYAVFGKVVEGMDVVDKIRQVEVRARDMMFQHLPTTTVVIKSVRRAP